MNAVSSVELLDICDGAVFVPSTNDNGIKTEVWSISVSVVVSDVELCSLSVLGLAGSVIVTVSITAA